MKMEHLLNMDTGDGDFGKAILINNVSLSG